VRLLAPVTEAFLIGSKRSKTSQGSNMTRVVCLSVLVVSLVALSGCSETKQSYVAKGNKLFAAGKYQDATLNYRAAIQKDAGYGEAYYRLGLAAIKLD